MSVVSGQEATNLVRAVCSAEGLSKAVSAATAPSCKLQFFSETNLLATLVVQEEWFGTEDGGEYLDRSGVLKALQRRLESDSSARRVWVDHWARGVLLNPEFPSIRNWGTELVHRYERGELRVGEDDEGSTSVAIPYKEVPAWLKAPHAYIHKDPSGQPDCVLLDWYHYGLAVGPTNQPTSFRAWYMTNLCPGIVAYHTGE